MRNILLLYAVMLLVNCAAVFGQVGVDPGMRHVHDPSMIYSDGYYYVFSTGRIEMKRSRDLVDWQHLGSAVPVLPEWVQDKVEGVSDLWAPDVTYHNGRYYICYSGSTWGSQRSVLGLMSNVTLDPYASNYEWVDEGMILESTPESTPEFNAIDGTFVRDASGDMWLVFGSHWEGIMLTRLDNSTLKPTTTPPTVHQIARRSNSVSSEGSYIIYRNGFYYLFVNWGSCCNGIDTDYKIMVGRSGSITGPYVDRQGVPMLYDNGGTLVVFNNSRWIGAGHADITTVGGQDYFTYHVYDGYADGTPTLRVNELGWSDDGWPELGDMVGVDPMEGDTVAYWDFEDGEAGKAFHDMPLRGTIGKVNEYIMRGFDLVAGPSFAFDSYDGDGLSLYCNGSQDGYSLDWPLSLWTPEEWTIEVSVKLNSLGGWNTIIGRDGSSRNEAEADFYLQNDGWEDNFRLNFATVGGNRWVVNTQKRPDVGKWYHLAVSCDGEVVVFYCDSIDGEGYQEIGRLDISSETVANNALAATGGTWTFGRGWFEGRLVDHVDGYIDNVRFSRRALAEDELLFFEPVTIAEKDGETVLYSNSEGYADSYTIMLNSEPSDVVTVVLTPDVGVSVGNGSGVKKALSFYRSNWYQPQTVEVAIAEAGVAAGNKIIEHEFLSDDAVYDGVVREVAVSIVEDSCGTWGYLPADYNQDCVVDMYDFELLAVVWLDGASMEELNNLAMDWLLSTQVYDEDIYGRTVNF